MIVLEVNRALLGEKNQCQQLIRLIPQLKGVGFDALYLLPVVEKGREKSVGSPYCIRDFWRLDPEFGTEQDWEELRESCVQNQIEIWIDWVMNHTAWDHPWIHEHPEWYQYSAETKKIIHPLGTNWEDVAQLDWQHPELLKTMSDIANRWIHERGVKGLRCDASYRIASTIWKNWIEDLNYKSNGSTRWIADREIENWQEVSFTGFADAGPMISERPGAWNKLYDHDRSAFGPLWNDEDEARLAHFNQRNPKLNWIVGMGMMDKLANVSFFNAQKFDQSKWEAWILGMSFGH